MRRSWIGAIVIPLLGTGCCKSTQEDPAGSTSSPSARTPAVATAAPTPAAGKTSAWLDKNGAQKISFGFEVPGGGKVTTKSGGFSSSAGSTIKVTYPTSNADDLVAAFQILAKKGGVELIDEPNPIAKAAWKIIYAGKPYKGHVIKSAVAEEVVLSLQSP